MEKSYRELDYTEVQNFANAIGINAETSENHREAAQLLFKTKEYIRKSNLSEDLQTFKRYAVLNKVKDSSFEALIYKKYLSATHNTMNLQLQILNMESELKRLKSQNSRERMKLSTQFVNKMNALINKTPTGDLRNELTELNILYTAICETIQ